jgi:hypothetical protein
MASVLQYHSLEALRPLCLTSNYLQDASPTPRRRCNHPFQVFKAAGFEVDFVSEKGTYVADWLSLQPSFLSGEDKEQWEDENGEFRQKVDNMPNVSSIDGKNVGPAPDRRAVTQLMYHFYSTASFSPARGMRP